MEEMRQDIKGFVRISSHDLYERRVGLQLPVMNEKFNFYLRFEQIVEVFGILLT